MSVSHPSIVPLVWQLQLSGIARVQDPHGGQHALSWRDAALLAWLAIEGPTPRARLAALLWPDSSTESARNSLRQRLFQLRKLIGTELVVGTTTLALAEHTVHDLVDSDGVLGSAPCEVGGEFAQWLELQRGRRRARVRESLVELAAMAERARDWADALAHARELLALEPLSEDAHRRVMRLHYLAGDRAAALLAFDACERVLKDEVGARPSAETRALLETIERALPDAPLRPAAAVPAALQRPPNLVGRAAELAQLERACSQGSLVLLCGEAGIGKTRLLAALRNVPAAGERLFVTARPGDAAVPYALAAKLLRALLQRDGVSPPTAAPDLALVLPELGSSPTFAREQTRGRLTAAAGALVAHAVDSGLRALVVDDLHFADDASVELLAPLIGNRSCAWVLAMRPGEIGTAAQALVSAHAAEPDSLRLDLQPLGLASIAQLIDSLGIATLSGAAMAEAMQRRTGGNPLYVLETIKAANAFGSELAPHGGAAAAPWPMADTVRRMIQQRLTRLGPLAMKVTRCAAIAGQDLSAPLVAEVLGLHPLDLADAWAELESAQVLRDASFAHDLIADAAMASVPDAVARPLHAQVAAFLERAQGEPVRVAAHWHAAGQPLKAVPHWIMAAQAAAKAWQNVESSRLFEWAARALLDAGDQRGAFDAYYFATTALSEDTVDDRLLPLVETLERLAADEGQRAMAALYRVAWLAESRRREDALQLALQASRWAAHAGLQDVEVELLWDQGALHWEAREVNRAIDCIEQALARLSEVRPRDVVRVDLERTRDKATQAAGVLYAVVGRYALAAERNLQSLQSARASGDRTRVLSCANSLATCAEDQGDLTTALRWSAQAVEGADDEHAAVQFSATYCSRRVALLVAAGDLGGALQMAELTIRLHAKGYQRSLVYDMVRVALLYADLGRRDLALKTLKDLQGRSDLQPVERHLLAAAATRAGERSDGAALLEAVGSIEDFALRVRLLCLSAPACEASQVLPWLTTSLASAREHGAHGLWVNLQSRRTAALQALGRGPEAAEAALSLWERIEQGVVGIEAFPRVAGELCAALLATQGHLAEVIALRTSAWVQRAASTLPVAWRDNFLYRSPALQGVPRSVRALPLE